MARASISLAPLTVLLVLSSISALNLPSPNALTQPDGILGGSNLTTAIINATTWNFASAPASSSEPNFLNSTSSADGEPICKGDSFGYLLDLTQCYDAIGRIIPSPGWSSFGDRGLGCDVQLPRRYSSCKTPAPAFCWSYRFVSLILRQPTGRVWWTSSTKMGLHLTFRAVRKYSTLRSPYYQYADGGKEAMLEVMCGILVSRFSQASL